LAHLAFFPPCLLVVALLLVPAPNWPFLFCEWIGDGGIFLTGPGFLSDFLTFFLLDEDCFLDEGCFLADACFLADEAFFEVTTCLFGVDFFFLQQQQSMMTKIITLEK
jgi:hypothetical protein